jgi:hypothetical protein
MQLFALCTCGYSQQVDDAAEISAKCLVCEQLLHTECVHCGAPFKVVSAFCRACGEPIFDSPPDQARLHLTLETPSSQR